VLLLPGKEVIDRGRVSISAPGRPSFRIAWELHTWTRRLASTMMMPSLMFSSVVSRRADFCAWAVSLACRSLRARTSLAWWTTSSAVAPASRSVRSPARVRYDVRFA
jgi:hypothetical protein